MPQGSRREAQPDHRSRWSAVTNGGQDGVSATVRRGVRCYRPRHGYVGHLGATGRGWDFRGWHLPERNRGGLRRHQTTSCWVRHCSSTEWHKCHGVTPTFGWRFIDPRRGRDKSRWREGCKTRRSFCGVQPCHPCIPQRRICDSAVRPPVVIANGSARVGVVVGHRRHRNFELRSGCR